jgi:TonB family protein
MSGAEVWKTWEGRVVDGKFTLRQLLGGSEHSAVFLTERPGEATGKVALKLIPADAGDADRQLVRWRAAAQLSHPHLIRIYETGRCGLTLLYLVMEYAEEDLSQILPQRALAPAEASDLLPPLLDALSYLHGKGFVHGRIKPSNVLAVGDLVKLSSDGITSVAEPNARRKRRDVYDAPETAAGIVSPAGDLWSVGATVVEALTQKPPLAGDAAQGDLYVPTNLPEPFRGIARECLHLEPKRRCSIADIKARMLPTGRSVPAEPDVVPPPPRSSKRVTVVAALLVVALAVGFVVFHSKGKSGTAATEVAPDQSAPQSAAANSPAASAATATRSAVAPVRAPAVSQAVVPPAKKVAASKGEVARQVLPEIPQSAKNTITGTIKIGVRVDVDSSGKVTEANLVSPGPSKYFASLVLRAAQQWEFSPPQVDGQPAPSAWVLKFRLRKSSLQVEPQQVKR